MGISVSNLEKSFGKQVLFSDVNFQINEGERVGLIGRNGHGKTTLFKIICKEDFPDKGEVILSKNYTLGYLQQTLSFTEGTILEDVLVTLPEEQRINRKWEAEKMLMGFGFGKNDFSRHHSFFSGGYQMRLQLVRVLLKKPDLLLLDEPTNFLDIGSVRWFIQFLKKWSGDIFFVSHDRSFMNAIATHIIGIHRQRVKKIKGQVQDYFRLVHQEEFTYENERINALRRQKQMESFIDGFRAKARQAGLVQSRIKALEKREKMEILPQVEKLKFTFNELDTPHKYALRIANLGFGYDEHAPWLFSDFSFELAPHARVGIIGLNGKGKSTFLRVINQELVPLKGSVTMNPRIQPSMFAQAHTVNLNPENTVENEILDVLERPIITEARNICGQMMFSGDQALKKIRILSGGEKCRVLLGKILAKSTNFLMLDEPDHHLDVESCEALSDALLKFGGALMLVTHNEFLLHTVCQELLVFTGSEIVHFRGSYGDFLKEDGWQRFESDVANKIEKNIKTDSRQKSDRQQRALFVQQKSKILRPLESKVRDMENRIIASELRLEQLDQDLIVASVNGDSAKIKLLSEERFQLSQEIEVYFVQLEEATKELDRLKQKLIENPESVT